MDNETDLSQTQSINETGSPQAATNPGASDAAPFQQSADADALKQNKSIQVEPTGKAITGTAHKAGTQASVIVFVIVSSIVLLMLASTVFRWVMKQPEKPKKNVEEPKPEAPKAPSYEVIRPKVKKKKLPRSKRHK